MKTIQLTKIIGIIFLFLVSSFKSLNEFTKSFKANFLKICLLFVTILVFPIIGFAQENGGPYTTDDNTVLLMHFEDNAENYANVGVNGIPHGSGVSYETSIDGHGNCIRLDNSTVDKQSWIEVPFYDELNFSDEFSIECWFKINSWGENTAGARSLFRKEGVDRYFDYEVMVFPKTKHLQANLDCIDDGRSRALDVTMADILELHKWYHISVYYNYNRNQHMYCLIRDENYTEIMAEMGYCYTPPVNSSGKLMLGSVVGMNLILMVG